MCIRDRYCLFDKTGTLTTDRLVPMGVVCLDAGGSDATPRSPEPLRAASNAAAAVLAACHSLVAAEDGAKDRKAKLVGDPIELTALQALGWTYDARTSTATPPTGLVANAAAKNNENPKKKAPKPLHGRVPEGSPPRKVSILSRFHFSSALQRMSVVADVDGVATALVKGSPEAVGALLRQAPAWFEPAYVGLAERGLRVLALASRRCDGDVERRDDVERDLELCGLAAFECKTRADSRVVVTALAQSAHRVAMVTGDAPLTALHVARECNIADGRPALVLEACGGGARWASRGRAPVAFAAADVAALAARGPLVVTEKALRAAAAAADDEEAVWRAVAGGVHVFARMSPQGKARICRSLQALHDAPSVLMCGDGGNDVGALKQADVGLALLAGYGDANTTGQGGYADAGAKLAAAKGDSSAEAVLNAQKEALEDAHRDAGQRRKAGIDAAQKDMAAKQKEWLEEEIRRREQRGETGFLAQAGAIKDVALRMKREMEVEVRKIDRGLGNVYDEQLGGEAPKDPMAAAQKLLGGLDDPNGPQMIRPGDASVAAPFTSRAPSIRAVVDLIRQGRCTLLSSLQQQQIMVLESVISAYTLAALSLEGARSSERQMMASGWRAGRVPRDADPRVSPAHTARSARRLLVVASLAFSYATPLESMHPIRPLGSLFHPSICAGPRGNPRERERPARRDGRLEVRAPRRRQRGGPGRHPRLLHAAGRQDGDRAHGRLGPAGRGAVPAQGAGRRARRRHRRRGRPLRVRHVDVGHAVPAEPAEHRRISGGDLADGRRPLRELQGPALDEGAVREPRALPLALREHRRHLPLRLERAAGGQRRHPPLAVPRRPVQVRDRGPGARLVVWDVAVGPVLHARLRAADLSGAVGGVQEDHAGGPGADPRHAPQGAGRHVRAVDGQPALLRGGLLLV